jgi:mannose-6-phosphate isomerase-like protein (cupin superfamily)
MVAKGNFISNKRTGEKITWLETAADTKGERLMLIFEVSLKGELSVTQFHPNQNETFKVLEGSIAFEIGEDEKTFSVSEKFTFPQSVPYRWWNPSETDNFKAIVTFQPALNTETFL